MLIFSNAKQKLMLRNIPLDEKVFFFVSWWSDWEKYVDSLARHGKRSFEYSLQKRFVTLFRGINTLSCIIFLSENSI